MKARRNLWAPACWRPALVRQLCTLEAAYISASKCRGASVAPLLAEQRCLDLHKALL